MEIPLVLIAQWFITEADKYARASVKRFGMRGFAKWGLRYAVTRYSGLICRLYALFAIHVGAAATLFSVAAIGFSSTVAVRSGEVLTRRDKAAIFLIIAAVLVRSLP